MTRIYTFYMHDRNEGSLLYTLPYTSVILWDLSFRCWWSTGIFTTKYLHKCPNQLWCFALWLHVLFNEDNWWWFHIVQSNHTSKHCASMIDYDLYSSTVKSAPNVALVVAGRDVFMYPKSSFPRKCNGHSNTRNIHWFKECFDGLNICQILIDAYMQQIPIWYKLYAQICWTICKCKWNLWYLFFFKVLLYT